MSCKLDPITKLTWLKCNFPKAVFKNFLMSGKAHVLISNRTKTKRLFTSTKIALLFFAQLFTIITPQDYCDDS